MNEVMGMFFMELYRKQCLAYSILETVGDGLVSVAGKVNLHFAVHSLKEIQFLGISRASGILGIGVVAKTG